VTVSAQASPAPGAAAPAAMPAPEPSMAPAMPAGPSAFSSAASQGRALQQQLLNQMKGDLFTWMLGIGVIIIGLALFLSMIDQAKIGRKQAKVDEGQLEQDKKDEYIRRRDSQVAKGVSGVTAPTAEERKARDTDKNNWQDAKADLQDEVKEASISARAWRYWYNWVAFIGAMMVAISSLAYVATGQTTSRRVVGAVILVFLLATFLGALIGKGPAISISP
jgi:hypothetical protein